jgi:hypothetical protein
VKQIQQFFNTANEVAEFTATLLGELSGEMAMHSNMYKTGQLITLLNTIYAIDQAKMMTPGIQNDFSFYRRSVGKFQSQAPVPETAANQISMWIAEATPMLSCLTMALKATIKKRPEVGGTLAKLANMCAWIVARDGGLSQKQKDELFVAMTFSIVLVDRATPRGAFYRESGVQIKKCIKTMVSEEHSRDSEVVMGCKNSLKYSTVHFNDANTPGFVEDLLE